MQLDEETKSFWEDHYTRLIPTSPREILVSHNLVHGWGVLELKHLVELYGFKKMDRVVGLAYRYNTLIYKRRMIRQSPISTKFSRKYYDTDVENLINGIHTQGGET